MVKEILLFAVMIGIMVAGSFVKIKGNKLPTSIVLLIAALAGAIFSGAGVPARILIEGTQQFFQLSLVVATGMMFMGILKANGALDALVYLIVKTFYKVKVLLLILIMALIMMPGMLTGSAPAAVLSTGVLCLPILKKIGIPDEEAAGIIAMGAIYGMAAPPINVPAMTIATGVYMPFQGFGGILCAITFPLAIFTVLFLGLRHVKTIDINHVLDGVEKAPKGKGFIIHIPMIFLILAMGISRAFPADIPDIGTSGIFVLATIIAFFTGKKINILKACREALVGSIDVLALFAMVGTLISVFAMNGVRGLMVYACMGMTGVLLYVAMAVGIPVLSGPLMPFGAAAVLGVPFVMALSNLDSIIVTSALSTLMALGALMPPTAISGQFAAKAAGIESYTSMIKKLIVPIILTAVVCVLVVVFAVPLAKIFC